MGLLDTLFRSLSGQGSAGGAGGMGTALLNLLASESGQDAAAAGSTDSTSPAAVSGGLNELVQRFEQNGFGDVIQSWIGSGSNQAISPDQLHQAIGSQTMDWLSQQTGMSHSQLLPLLAQALPLIVDRLTPNQRVPDQHEIAQMQPETASGQPIEV
jgi:uncharacterized protein YidB (DUF937 family)